MSVKTSHVDLSVADGSSMQAYTALPASGGPYPGLLLFQEAFGVNHHIRNVAERFAAQGYAVIAPELFHRSAPKGLEIPYNDFPSVMPHMQAVNESNMEHDVKAAYAWLENNSEVEKGNISSVGYCMGGRVSFLANSVLPLRTAICYYGGRIVPDLIKRAPALYAPMLFFWGGLDKHIPPEHVATVVAEMRNAGKDFINVEISYAEHAFFCDERASYHPKAAAEAWALTLAFLKQHTA